MSAAFYLVGKQPVFLTFKAYTAVINMCEESKAITKEERSAYELFGGTRIIKKVFNAINTCLENLKAADPQTFSEIISFDCRGSEACNNLCGLLRAVAACYGGLEFETISGRSSDIRFTEGKQYYVIAGGHKKTGRLKINIDTEKVTAMCGSLDNFNIQFDNGMAIAGRSGDIYVSFQQAERPKVVQPSKSIAELQAEADRLFFHKSEITPEIRDRLDELGIKIRILNDDEYEMASAEEFCDWLSETHPNRQVNN